MWWSILTLGFLIFFALDIYIRLRLRADDDQKKVLSLLEKINNIISSSITNVDTVAQQVSDAVAFDLGFKVGVILLVDERRKLLKRVAVSRTERVKKAVMELGVEFKGLETPLDNKENLPVQVALDGVSRRTESVHDLLKPHFTLKQADYIQKVGELSASLIYPLIGKNRKIIGVMIISLSEHWKNLTDVQKKLIQKVIDVVGIALDNAMLYENLDTVSKQLEKANLKLLELDQLKDDFVSVASHELRTPMTAIRSYVWMALHKSDIPLSQRLERYLYRTLVSTERLINLVSDMLNVSRIESGKIEIDPRSFDIVALVKDVLEEVKAKADEKRLQLISLEHRMPPVFADPDKVHEILLNIIGNALKFTYPGGIISVSFFTDGKIVEVSVKDSGLGISYEDLGKLFTKFGRLDNSYTALSTSGGTGLGLYISKSLTELMHGRIWASSEGLDKGATFTFSLPIATQEVLSHVDQFRIRAKGEAKGLEPVAI